MTLPDEEEGEGSQKDMQKKIAKARATKMTK